ncbi:hypothetical protein KUTeg_017989 [Tegillarca granosa]|uniref:C2H2-type domain-containing protein n=1 Tax=Tegillarca granosa TaxID=220873 RepID=A0ABQ9EKK0_TEGGR|nr:hypothetical protein KUTeg_017989 [Tegillarca granosa]
MELKLKCSDRLNTVYREKQDMDTASYVNEISSKISMSLPASLSLLPLPGNIYSSNIYNHNKMNKPEKESYEMFKMEVGHDIEHKNSTRDEIHSSFETPCEKEAVPSLESQNEINACTEENVVIVEDKKSESEKEKLKDFKEQVCTSNHKHLLQNNLQLCSQVYPTHYKNETHQVRQDWSCEICGKEIFTFETIVQHTLDFHQTSESDNAIICPLCSNSFKKICMHDFLQHIRLHLKQKTNLGEKESVEQNILINDFPNVDLGIQTSKDNKGSLSFYSRQCVEGQNCATVVDDSLKVYKTKKFKNEQKSKINCDLSEINPEVNEKLFCTICYQLVKGYKEIINHNKKHGKTNQCPICQRHFSMRDSLLRHCFSHTKNKLFSCHVCTAVFTRKDNLKRHIHKLDHYGPVIINMQNRSQFLPNGGSVFKGKEKKNKVLKLNYAATKQESFTSFKRNNVFLKKFSTTLMKPNKIWKNNSKSQNVSSTRSISSYQDQHGVINNINISSQEVCFQDTLVGSSHGKLYIDSNTQVHDTGNLEETPRKHVFLPETKTNLNYNCSICSISFIELSSLKRHVIACHSEQSSEQSVEDYHHKQNMPPHCHIQTDEINTSAPEESWHTKEWYSLNHNEKVNADNGYQPADTGRFSQSDTGKVENHESLNTTDQFGFKNEVIDIEILGQLPELTPQKQFKEENTNDQQFFSIGSEEFKLSCSEEFKLTSQNQAFKNNLFGLQATNSPPVSCTKEKDKPMQSPMIKVSSLISRSNQDRRHRMLNSKFPICYFCGIYLESGAEIVSHGDDHQDLFENSCTCTICLQVLCGRDSLQRHARSHIGTSFDCFYCNACFSRKDNLKRHLKKVHNLETSLNEPLFSVIKS